jgi:hypothetical protein
MNPLTSSLSNNAAADEDLANQAHPGHGIPSQDPDPTAQFALDPKETQREAKSVLTGGGVVAGAATGATIGVLVAGPVGVVVGVALGTVVGALGGAAAASTMALAGSGNTDSAPEEVDCPAPPSSL